MLISNKLHSFRNFRMQIYTFLRFITRITLKIISDAIKP